MLKGGVGVKTYSFLNGTELLKLLAKSVLIGVPGKAAVAKLAETREGCERESTYPMNSLDILMDVVVT